MQLQDNVFQQISGLVDNNDDNGNNENNKFPNQETIHQNQFPEYEYTPQMYNGCNSTYQNPAYNLAPPNRSYRTQSVDSCYIDDYQYNKHQHPSYDNVYQQKHFHSYGNEAQMLQNSNYCYNSNQKNYDSYQSPMIGKYNIDYYQSSQQNLNNNYNTTADGIYQNNANYDFNNSYGFYETDYHEKDHYGFPDNQNFVSSDYDGNNQVMHPFYNFNNTAESYQNDLQQKDNEYFNIQHNNFKKCPEVF